MNLFQFISVTFPVITKYSVEKSFLILKIFNKTIDIIRKNEILHDFSKILLLSIWLEKKTYFDQTYNSIFSRLSLGNQIFTFMKHF